MCKEEKPTVKREIFYDDVNERWRDWLGNVWSVDRAPLAETLEKMAANVFNRGFYTSARRQGKSSFCEMLERNGLKEPGKTCSACVKDFKASRKFTALDKRIEETLLKKTLYSPIPMFFGKDMGASEWFLDADVDDGVYAFRGDINLDHLVHDCINDDRLGFIAIGPDATYIGVIAGAIKGRTAFPAFFDSNAWTTIIDGYHIYKITKSNTPDAVKFLPDAVAAYRKVLKKMARKIKKQRGKLSDKPETKVMTY